MRWTLCLDCAHLGDKAVSACPRCGSARGVAHAELASLDVAHIDCDAFYASVEKGRSLPGMDSASSAYGEEVAPRSPGAVLEAMLSREVF